MAEGWRERVAALLGVSAYAPPRGAGPSLDDASVESLREQLGGQISPLPQTKTRWVLADLEAAQRAADTGDLSLAAQLCRAMKRDAVLAGLLRVRTAGLVRLPKRFSGDSEQARVLEGRDGARSVFDAMFPPTELAALAADGILLGVGLAELVPVEGRDYPVLVRLDPEWLRFRWAENTWYYNSIAGPIPIYPGDGRLMLHIPGGRLAPWQSGLWYPLGESYINKSHAKLNNANWEGKLANPARVAIAPQAATEEQHQRWFQQVMAWGINTVFGLKPGYDVKLLESNGRGYESFAETIARSDREYMIALAGSTVMVDGGTGFANADIHKSVQADLIKDTAEGLAFTVNTQGIPPFVAQRWGVDALDRAAVVEWDVTPPKDLLVEAQSLKAAAEGIGAARAELAQFSKNGVLLSPDITELANRYGIPIAGDADGDGTPDEEQGFEREEAEASAEPAEDPANDVEEAA